MPEECLAQAREALEEAQKAAPMAAMRRVCKDLDGAVRTAMDDATEASIQGLRSAINRGMAVGLSEEQLAAAREDLQEVQRNAALASLQRARDALDEAARIAVETGQGFARDSIEALRRAINQGTAVGIAESHIKAARETME